jgi:hypothetical protein
MEENLAAEIEKRAGNDHEAGAPASPLRRSKPSAHSQSTSASGGLGGWL